MRARPSPVPWPKVTHHRGRPADGPAGPAGPEGLGRPLTELDEAGFPVRFTTAGRAPQVQLLQEIYAVYRARSGQPFYYGYGYGDDKSIDLSAFESRQLWPLLDEAAALGLRLVRGRNLGSLDGYRSAELCLDLTRADQSGPLVITPQIRVDGAPAADHRDLASSARRAMAWSTPTAPKPSATATALAGDSSWPGWSSPSRRSCSRWRWPGSRSRSRPRS